jgi:hypothetical protein
MITLPGFAKDFVGRWRTVEMASQRGWRGRCRIVEPVEMRRCQELEPRNTRTLVSSP